jgi:hypothetical protein
MTEAEIEPVVSQRSKEGTDFGDTQNKDSCSFGTGCGGGDNVLDERERFREQKQSRETEEQSDGTASEGPILHD